MHADGSPERLRFEAARRRAFHQMALGTSRFRAALIVPFQLFVLGVLLVRHASWVSIALQVIVLCLMTTHIACSTYLLQKSPRSHLILLALGTVSLMLSVVNTGGLASPLMLTFAPVLFAATVAVDAVEHRKAYFAAIVLAAVGLAFYTRTGLAEAALPYIIHDGHVTTEHLVLTLGCVLFVVLGVIRMGDVIHSAYAQIAIELASRREELADETADRTRAVETIAARLAHEVKNPLAAIRGLSSHMARTTDDPKVAERLAIVASEAERLQSIVDGFLSFSRGLDDLSVAPLSPYEVARELTLLLETRAAEAGITLSVSGASDLSISADARKLRQALLNLVVNAIQASRPGSAVDLRIRKGHSKDCAVIEVEDAGAGMTAEVLERIQKPYFTTKETGTGLGVAIARSLVEQHGGSLVFESRVGKGTTAIVTLPTTTCAMAAAKVLPCPRAASVPGANSLL